MGNALREMVGDLWVGVALVLLGIAFGFRLGFSMVMTAAHDCNVPAWEARNGGWVTRFDPAREVVTFEYRGAP